MQIIKKFVDKTFTYQLQQQKQQNHEPSGFLFSFKPFFHFLNFNQMQEMSTICIIYTRIDNPEKKKFVIT